MFIYVISFFVYQDADDGLSPELMRYLDRNYWEQKDRDTSVATPSKDAKDSPTTTAASVATHSSLKKAKQSTEKMVLPASTYPTSPLKDKTDEDLDEFVMTLKTQVEIFVNRMKSNSSRGRSIANDSSVQTLFMNTMAMHSQLLRHIQAQEDKRVYYEGLQDKLTQVQ
jgi:growth factor-regulated tyrosine kinase substrate